jgi:hypothetical protein
MPVGFFLKPSQDDGNFAVSINVEVGKNHVRGESHDPAEGMRKDGKEW